MNTADPAGLEPDPVRAGRRWPLGTLSLIAVVSVIVVTLTVAFLAGGDEEPAAPAEAASPSLSTPVTAASIPLLPPGAPETGEVAADFAIDLYDGSRFVLTEHLANDGRPVFLNLWASWCPPCREEMPDIDAAADRYPGVYFLGVAVEDDPRAAEAFAEQVGVDYPLGFDETDRVSVAYPHFGLPATYVIATDGTLAGRIFGGVSESQIDELLAGVIG